MRAGVPLNYCPECRHMLDDATVLCHKDALPKPGDISICFYCGTVLRFDKNRALRRATKRDLKDFDPEQRRLIERAVISLKIRGQI